MASWLVGLEMSGSSANYGEMAMWLLSHLEMDELGVAHPLNSKESALIPIDFIKDWYKTKSVEVYPGYPLASQLVQQKKNLPVLIQSLKDAASA